MLASLLSNRDRAIFWSVVASILLHLVLLVPAVRDAVPKDLFETKEVPVVLAPMEFELVNPPQNPTPSDRLSKYLSTVSSAASDDSPKDDGSALPKSDGTSPFPETPSQREGAEGGGQGELPPLPEDMGDLGEAFKRSKFLDQMSPTRELSLPEMNSGFKNESSARASVGGISINTTAWDFAPYLLDLKQRVKQHWIPPLAFTALGAIHGYTKINFRIYPDGRMESLAVVETEGHESLHRSSLNAIKGAAP
ncbi:MAG: rane protein, partial [Candidatus Krumholzibacteriota bacterium]|nr:rane protein [Candidatus Krumholzibacteriota bacterium]